MDTVAAFIDMTNLYFTVGKKYNRNKIDYLALKNKLASYGDLKRLIAYGTYTTNDVTDFENHLKTLGYEVKYKQHYVNPETKVVRRVNWDVQMTLDMIQLCDRVSTVILVSNNREMTPVISYIKHKSIKTVTIGCGLPKDLLAVSDRYYEINETLFETKKETVSQEIEEEVAV